MSDQSQPELVDSGIEMTALLSRLSELELIIIQERSARIRVERVLQSVEEAQNATAETR